MTNILIFAITTFAYFWIFYLLEGLLEKPLKQRAKELCIVALLCLPLNINGNVFTVLGNAESDKNIFSVFSVYQKADGDAFSVFGSFVQLAGNEAVIMLGISGFQKAGNKAVMGFGVNGYQKGGKDAGGFFLISGYQESGEVIINIFGFTGYQKAGNAAAMLCCLVGRQDASRAGIQVGLAGYQNSTKLAETYASVALLQRVGKQERAFAMWSQLQGAN